MVLNRSKLRDRGVDVMRLKNKVALLTGRKYRDQRRIDGIWRGDRAFVRTRGCKSRADGHSR